MSGSPPGATPPPGPAPASPPRGLHRLAYLTSIAAFILLFAGGLVTSTGSGDTIPTWPDSFGGVLPRAERGVLFEWSHRALAGIVAILAFALVVLLFRREPRRGVRTLGALAFAGVLAQAALGGLRVLLDARVPMAMAHAVLAQWVFGALVAVAAVTSPKWAEPRERSGAVAALGLAAVSLLGVQLAFGVLLRHTGKGFALHVIGASAVIGSVGFLAMRALPSPSAAIRRPATAALGLTLVQLILGMLTYVIVQATPGDTPALLLRAVAITAHVAVGASILAMCIVTTLRAWP